MVRKLLKILGILFVVVLVAFITIYAVYNEKLPEGRPGADADALAQKMLSTLNYDKFKQTRFLEWSFQGGAHQYKWDKEKRNVAVSWDDFLVNLDLIAPESSLVFKNGERLMDIESEAFIEKAVGYFNNDSFWLVAPYKVFDSGVTRSIVPLPDGTDGLLVTYTTGGSTPGDSYLWMLQPNGFPKSFKMWVNIIPIGGIEATWDDWDEMESGVFLPKSHEMGPVKLLMGDIQGYNRKR
ncbi:hypothetical protein [Maribacter antarcticus]|uniref:hypothetical protein n=1 Tax=Maribacter antarcticus TaxID=505250 RepID=UPI000478B5ED|nr:hypothetical protein [Maribacter antarcticus]